MFQGGNYMFQKILVPIDGSSPSQDALKTAANIAKTMQSKLAVLYVIDLTSAYIFLETMTALNSQQIHTMTDELETKGKQILNDAATEIQSTSLTCESILRTGHPARVICEVAKAENFDLIIMGSRGLSDFKGLLLGSVSHQVLQRSHCPVLLVK